MADNLVTEAGIVPILHCWAVDVVMEGDAIKGIITESKSGRQAVLAKVVIDSTGDGTGVIEIDPVQVQNIGVVSEVARVGEITRDNRTREQQGFHFGAGQFNEEFVVTHLVHLRQGGPALAFAALGIGG